VSIRGVGRSRARTLFDNGYHDRMSLAGVDVRALASLPGIGKSLANSIKKQVGDSVPEPPPVPDMDEDELNYMLEKMAAEEDAKGDQSSLDSF
jgi:helicase